MNSYIFIRRMKELNKNINKLERKLDYGYEDDLEHDYGYESSYHNLYDTHQLPHLGNKDFPTISSGPVSRHEPRSQSQSNPYSQVTRVVKKQDKRSPFDFSEIPGAPHPMPNDYIRRLPSLLEIMIYLLKVISIFSGITWKLEVQTMNMFICEP